MASKSDFISNYRKVITNLLDALEEHTALKRQYDALGYGSALVDGDFVGANADLTAQQFKDALGNAETVTASVTLGGLLPVGLLTNLYRLKVG